MHDSEQHFFPLNSGDMVRRMMKYMDSWKYT